MINDQLTLLKRSGTNVLNQRKYGKNELKIKKIIIKMSYNSKKA
jgi:hypothetical protein